MILAYVILKTAPTDETLAGIDEDDYNIRFSSAPTGFLNADLTMDYLKHFNQYSFLESFTFKHREATLIGWFGYDEHLLDCSKRQIDLLDA